MAIVSLKDRDGIRIHVDFDSVIDARNYVSEQKEIGARDIHISVR